MLCWSLRVELAAWAGCGHQAGANRQATREAGQAMVTSAPRMSAAGEQARGCQLQAPDPATGLTIVGEDHVSSVYRRDLLGGLRHEYRRAA